MQHSPLLAPFPLSEMGKWLPNGPFIAGDCQRGLTMPSPGAASFSWLLGASCCSSGRAPQARRRSNEVGHSRCAAASVVAISREAHRSIGAKRAKSCPGRLTKLTADRAIPR